MMNTLLAVHPKVILVNAKPVRGDLEAAPVGIYDVIRDDVRQLSTIKPVDRIFVERTQIGYRGVLYSHDRPYIFALNGNGFTAKPLDSEDVAVLSFCTKLEEAEQKLTAQFDAERADREQDEFNLEIGIRALPSYETGDVTAINDAPTVMTQMWGPKGPDAMERIPGNYRQSLGLQRTLAKETIGVCGGGIVMSKEGKVLLIKPKNGYGGYDWTFPKGYPISKDEPNEWTAKREVHEETGLVCTIGRKLGRFTHNDGGICDYYVMTPQSEKFTVDDEEVEAAKWATLVEALELLNDDVDVKILAQANQLIPTLIIKGGDHKGTMIALHLPKKIANQVALRGGESPDDMHITLAYLGKGLTEKQKKAAAKVVRRFAGLALGIKASLSGVGRFSASESSEGRDVIYLSVDSTDLTRLHPYLMELLSQAGLKSGSDHGFTPHVTLTFVEKNEKTPLERFDPIEIDFKSVVLSVGGKRMAIPFQKSVLIKANVKNPGSRGGKWYRDEKGEAQYGEKPSKPKRKYTKRVKVDVKAEIVKSTDYGISWLDLATAIDNLPDGPLADQPHYKEQAKVRQFLRAVLKKEHIDKQPMGEYGADDMLFVSDKVTEPIGAAFHNWKGDTWINSQVHRSFRSFCNLMSFGASTVPGHSAEAFRMMLHEELHGFSDMLPEAYVGVGVIVEEVATEIAARAITRLQFGEVKLNLWNEEKPSKISQIDAYTPFAPVGSYSDFIFMVLESVSKVLGTRENAPLDSSIIASNMLEAASLELKTKVFSKAATAQKHLDNFVSCFGGLSTGEQEILAGLLEDQARSR